MARPFAYFHEAREVALVIMMPRTYDSLVFISGSDFGFRPSLFHGESYKIRKEEGRHLQWTYRYKFPTEFYHTVVVRVGINRV